VGVERRANEMPPGRTATAAAPRRRTRQPPRSGRAARRTHLRRIRWDRIGRVGLLVVLIVVGGLYVQQALAYLSARAQAHRHQSLVRNLQRQNAALAKEQSSLRNPATVQREARELGMVRLGERPYVVTGLPNH
jgi:cell division protein FtsB